MLTMLSLFGKVTLAIITMAVHSPTWSRRQMLEHEWGHINCPQWTHSSSDMASINPPKECRGNPKKKGIRVELHLMEDLNKVRSICTNGPRAMGSDACTLIYEE